MDHAGLAGTRPAPAKAHLACGGRGLTPAVVVAPGNVNGSTVNDTILREETDEG